jgi:hypothetical protein
VVPVTGLYLITGQVCFTTGQTGDTSYGAAISRNSVNQVEHFVTYSGNASLTAVPVDVVLALAAGDTIGLHGDPITNPTTVIGGVANDAYTGMNIQLIQQ